MSPLRLDPKFIVSTSIFRRAGFSPFRRCLHDASHHPRRESLPPLKNPPNDGSLELNHSKGSPSSTDSISHALRDANPEDNTLLAPVRIFEDPDGVLHEKHPAAKILANSAIVVQRQLEIMNVLIGFEQANKYVIMDPQGNHIGFIAERELGAGNMMARQMFRTHRSFTAHVFDKFEKEVLRFHRSFSWISSRIGVYDPLEGGSTTHSSSRSLSTGTSELQTPGITRTDTQVSPLALSDMRIIGEAHQQWAPLRRKYNLFTIRQLSASHDDSSVSQLPAGEGLITSPKEGQATLNSREGDHRIFDQFAYVDEPFLSWDFSLRSADSRLIGSVNRNFSGFGREIFTDTGVYALRMDAAGLAAESPDADSKTGQKNEIAQTASGVAMTLDQRAVMLATAVSVDFDYFSRKSGGGFMPLWFPGWGGGAAGEAAGGVAGAEAAGGAAAGAGAAVGAAARQAGGMGEGAVAGAATMAGYDALQRGSNGDGGAPAPDQSPSTGYPEASSTNSPQNPAGQHEEVWGEQGNFSQEQGMDRGQRQQEEGDEKGHDGGSDDGGDEGDAGGGGDGGGWTDWF